MSISDADMTHLKTLARLELSDDETEHRRGDLNKILAYVEQLGELDTDGVEELVRPTEGTNAFRDDTPHESLTQNEALGLAQKQHEGFFSVPRTVETGE